MNTPRPGPPGRFSADPAEAVMLTDILFAQAERLGDKPFLHGRIGGRIGGRAGDIGKDENGDGAWATLSWAEAADQVRRLAGGLTRIGIKPGDRVVLVSENSPQWLIADHAIMAAGAITVPGYTTNTEDDHLHLLTDSGAAAAIVATNALALRLMPAAERSSDCRHVIAMEPVALGQALDFETHLWDDLLRSDPAPPHEGSRTDTACIIYTSGTGGAPKGVMLSHGAILSNCDAIKHVFRDFDLSAEVFLSFLPLSHSYEHTAGQFFPVSIGAEIYYAKGTDTLAQDMAQVRPSFMTAVPRLYELFQGRIMLGLKKASPFSRALF
ncbi:MAG: AMP-binding protein, partial [Alphaproteobacteria bacterium]|nr:AMP-binding protein [Alphaproteobacteria bacterium]